MNRTQKRISRSARYRFRTDGQLLLAKHGQTVLPCILSVNGSQLAPSIAPQDSKTSPSRTRNLPTMTITMNRKIDPLIGSL